MRQVSIGISRLSIETMLFLRDSYKALPIKLPLSSGIHMHTHMQPPEAVCENQHRITFGILYPGAAPQSVSAHR
jgi:hypothetical protein